MWVTAPGISGTRAGNNRSASGDRRVHPTHPRAKVIQAFVHGQRDLLAVDFPHADTSPSGRMRVCEDGVRTGPTPLRTWFCNRLGWVIPGVTQRIVRTHTR